MFSSKTTSIQGKIDIFETQKNEYWKEKKTRYFNRTARLLAGLRGATVARLTPGCVFESGRGQFPPTLEFSCFFKSFRKRPENSFGICFSSKSTSFQGKIDPFKAQKNGCWKEKNHSSLCRNSCRKGGASDP